MQLSRELGHFNRAKSCFEALIAALQARAIDGLFESVAGEHAKHYGYSGVELSELQPASSFGTDVIVVSGLAAQDAADGNERVVFAGQRQFLGNKRKFERTGHMNHGHVFTLCVRAIKSVDSGAQQSLGDETVESADNNRKAQTARAQAARNLSRLKLLRQG